MPPTLLLIRHAQALHNVAGDWSIHDAPLSELGEQQCLELQESLENSKIGNEVELIVVSAMRRTLQTATIGLDWLIKKGIRGELHPRVPIMRYEISANYIYILPFLGSTDIFQVRSQ